MTYYELYQEAEYQLEHNKITLGEFEKMIEPLNREVETQTNTTESVLEDIKAEIIKNIENTKDYEDEALFNSGLKFALEIIDSHISGKE